MLENTVPRQLRLPEDVAGAERIIGPAEASLVRGAVLIVHGGLGG